MHPLSFLTVYLCHYTAYAFTEENCRMGVNPIIPKLANMLLFLLEIIANGRECEELIFYLPLPGRDTSIRESIRFSSVLTICRGLKNVAKDVDLATTVFLHYNLLI